MSGCLCFVALVMTVVKCKSQSKRREMDSKDRIVPVTVPKSILKKSEGERNPDILKGIGQFSPAVDLRRSFKQVE